MQRDLVSDVLISDQSESANANKQEKSPAEIEMIKINYLQKKREKKAQAKEQRKLEIQKKTREERTKKGIQVNEKTSTKDVIGL